MAENIKDAIISISRGRSSRLRIGSRAMAHRLRKEEKRLLDIAIRKGYLEIYPWSRVNASNIFKKINSASSKTPIFCEHKTDHSIVWYQLNNLSEIPALDLVPGDYEFKVIEGIVNFYPNSRDDAKKLAKALSLYLKNIS